MLFGLIGFGIGIIVCLWAVEKYPHLHLAVKVLLFLVTPPLLGYLGYRCKSIRYLSW